MRGIEAQAPPDRFCAFGSHAVGSGGRGHMIVAVFAHYQGASVPKRRSANRFQAKERPQRGGRGAKSRERYVPRISGTIHKRLTSGDCSGPIQ
jgi:hypothetical protein